MWDVETLMTKCMNPKQTGLSGPGARGPPWECCWLSKPSWCALMPAVFLMHPAQIHVSQSVAMLPRTSFMSSACLPALTTP